MLTARYSVIIDAGHGPGTPSPSGSKARGHVERDIILRVVAEAAGALASAGVTVRVIGEGDYTSRQRDDLVTTADLYLAIHADIQGSKTPYALALALPASQDAAGRLVAEYARGVGLRWIVGEPGTASWPRGRDLLRHVPEHVPAVLLELGSLSHPACDGLWADAATTGAAVARAVVGLLGR